MPSPTIGSVHQNKALENVAIAYKNEEYVLDQAFPVVPVEKESDVYHVWTKADMLRSEALAVSPGARAPRGGFSIGAPVVYTTECIKFAWPVPDRIARNADTPVRALIEGTEMAMDQVLLAREIRITTILTTAANWTATYTGYATPGTLAIAVNSEWNTANGVPIDNIVFTAKRAVRDSCGRRANTMVISEDVAEALMHNDQIILRVRNSVVDRPAVVDMAALGAVLRIPKILVVSAVRNTAMEGQAVTMAEVFGDNCWIGYVAPSPSIMAPSAGYTFQVAAPSVRTWREEAEEQDVTEAAVNFVAARTAADAGFLITNCLL